MHISSDPSASDPPSRFHICAKIAPDVVKFYRSCEKFGLHGLEVNRCLLPDFIPGISAVTSAVSKCLPLWQQRFGVTLWVQTVQKENVASSSVGSRCYLNGLDQPVQWTALISYAFEALFGLLFKTVKLQMALISLW